MTEEGEKPKTLGEIREQHQISQVIESLEQIQGKTEEPIKEVFRSPNDKNLKSSTLRTPKIPEKYNHLIHSHIQISLQSVRSLVVAMDSNNDGKVTLEDIINYAHKNHLFLKQELLEGIFYDAISYRYFKTRKGYENPIEPLTAEEIHNAVRLSLQKTQDHWEEKGRNHRDIWMLLFETLSKKLADGRERLPKVELAPIKGVNETSQNTYFPTLPQMKSRIHVFDPKPAPFTPPHRTEAGIVIHNTENIMEIFLDKEKYDSKKVDPLNTIINARFHSIDDKDFSVNPYDTIGFDTQQYFNEGYRLSMNPKLLKKSERHPIFSYVPENFNFSADKEMQEKLKEKERLYELERNYNPLMDSPFERTFSEKETPVSSGKKKSERGNFDKSKYEFPNQEMKILENSYSKGMLMSILRNKERELAFEMRKKQFMTQKIKKAEEEEGGDPKKLLFHTWFKNEDCETLKKRLAQTEPIKNPYNPPSAHQFRDDIPSENKPFFKNRFKDSVLDQKVELKAEDLIPKEVLLRSQKDKLKSDKKEQENMDEFLGKKTDKKDWVHFFPLADKRRNFADMKLPEFIEKGTYNEPIEILNTLLRGEQGFEIPFRLYHKPLRTYDKNMFMGDIKASKF